MITEIFENLFEPHSEEEVNARQEDLMKTLDRFFDDAVRTGQICDPRKREQAQYDMLDIYYETEDDDVEWEDVLTALYDEETDNPEVLDLVRRYRKWKKKQ